MQLQDLRPGWRTDFILHRYGAEVVSRATHLVVRTPANPTFYWGNCLILPAAPRDEDLARWLARFDADIARDQPASTHVAIGVDAPYEDQPYPSWRAAGFEVVTTTMLRLQPGQLALPAHPVRNPVVFRKLDLASESEALIELEMTHTQDFEPEGYRLFRRRQHQRHHAMQRDGLMQWFGLWCDGTLAATCGLMREGAEPGVSGRFQYVTTHAAWRRRGLCTALIHAVSEFGFTQWRLADLYMAADPDDVAIGIYRALGYRDIGSGFALQRNSPQDRLA